MAHLITPGTSSIPSSSITTTLPSTSSSLTSGQFDKFFQSCSIIALSKKLQNIAVVSCQYSSNVYINQIADFIYLIKPNPSIIIVPLFHSGRISLAVFFIANKKVGYFDSLKQAPIYSFSFAKAAIEKYLKCSFSLINQETINSTINANPVPELANFHICRIAEEICFNGRNQKLVPFDIILESQRIKKLISMVTDKAWKGEWIANLNNSSGRGDLINPAGSGGDSVRDDIAALASVVEACGTGNVPSTTRSRSKDRNNGYQIPSGSASSSVTNDIAAFASVVAAFCDGNGTESSNIPSTSRSRSRENVEQQLIQTINKLATITSTSMTDFNVKYPIIAKMLNSYLNFTKRRNDFYNRNEKACAMQNIFNWKIFTQMDHNGMEDFLTMLADFPFFVELSETDKMALFKRFWVPFSLLERVYDTVNTLDSSMNGNFIVLQNGAIFNLDGLLKAPNPAAAEKAAFEAWNLLMPLMKKIDPHCLEVMYIFCCLLWNISFLEVPLSVEGEDLIRRGRLLVHKEMREFYDYDDSQWERIYALRHVILTVENCVKAEKIV